MNTPKMTFNSPEWLIENCDPHSAFEMSCSKQLGILLKQKKELEDKISEMKKNETYSGEAFKELCIQNVIQTSSLKMIRDNLEYFSKNPGLSIEELHKNLLGIATEAISRNGSN